MSDTYYAPDDTWLDRPTKPGHYFAFYVHAGNIRKWNEGHQILITQAELNGDHFTTTSGRFPFCDYLWHKPHVPDHPAPVEFPEMNTYRCIYKDEPRIAIWCSNWSTAIRLLFYEKSEGQDFLRQCGEESSVSTAESNGYVFVDDPSLKTTPEVIHA